MVNNGDVHIEKPSDCLVAQCFSCSACVLTLGVFDLKRRCTEWSVHDIKVPRERYEQIKPMLSNRSRGTLMSYTDHSVQRRFKSNTPTDWISQHCLVIT